MPATSHTLRALLRYAFSAFAAVVMLFGTAASFGQDATPPGEPPKKRDDLGERLIRKTVTNADEDIMATIVRLMTEVSRKMEIEFDPGEETQAVQGRVRAKLDEAIKAAASKQRMRRHSP